MRREDKRKDQDKFLRETPTTCGDKEHHHSNLVDLGFIETLSGDRLMMTDDQWMKDREAKFYW